MSTRYDLSEADYAASRDAFARSIELAGGQTKFAEICGCTQGNISQLLAKGSLLPFRFAPKVEAALGIPRAQLRPDVFAMLAICPTALVLGTDLVLQPEQSACNRAAILPQGPAND